MPQHELEENDVKRFEYRLDGGKSSMTQVNWADRSLEIDKLAAALAKAQGEIEAAKKDSANPFYKSKYADLASVWDAIRVPLSKNGLSIIQDPYSKIGVVGCYTTLLHSSGQYTRSNLEVPVGKQDAQGYGSAITYVRRYQLQAIAGVAPEDDDGNAASGQGKQAPQAQTGKQPKDLTADQLEWVKNNGTPEQKKAAEKEQARREESLMK